MHLTCASSSEVAPGMTLCHQLTLVQLLLFLLSHQGLEWAVTHRTVAWPFKMGQPWRAGHSLEVLVFTVYCLPHAHTPHPPHPPHPRGRLHRGEPAGGRMWGRLQGQISKEQTDDSGSLCKPALSPAGRQVEPLLKRSANEVWASGPCGSVSSGFLTALRCSSAPNPQISVSIPKGNDYYLNKCHFPLFSNKLPPFLKLK